MTDFITAGSQAGGQFVNPLPNDAVSEQSLDVVRRCFKDSIEPNFHNALANHAPIAGLMVGLAAIDFLAHYYCGKDGGPAGFKDFLDKYIVPLVPAGSIGYNSKLLYRNLRNGLFHNYTTACTPTDNFQKTDVIYVLIDDPNRESDHLKTIRGKQNRVLFHIGVFFKHVAQASNDYFNEVATDTKRKARFARWYGQSSHLTGIDPSQLGKTAGGLLTTR